MIELSKALRYYIRGLGDLLGAECVTVYIPAPLSGLAEPLLLHSGDSPALAELSDPLTAKSSVASLEPGPGGVGESGDRLRGLVAGSTLDTVLISLAAVEEARSVPSPGFTGPALRRGDRRAAPRPSTGGAWLGLRLPSGRGSAIERLEAALSPGAVLPQTALPGRWWEWLLSVGGALTSQTMQAFASSSDAVTGLPGRLQFRAILAERLEQARLDGKGLGLLLINPDDFVEVNERLGQEVGDRCIREIGIRLRASLREGDLLVRYGGVVFAAVLADCSPELVGAVSERFVRELSDSEFLGGDVELSFSIGFSVFDPAAAEDPQFLDLVLRADRALSAAKRRGGGRAVGFEDGSGAEQAESFDRMSGIFTGNMSQDYRNMVLLWDAVNVIALQPEFDQLVAEIVGMLFDTFKPLRVGLFAGSSAQDLELLAGLTRISNRHRGQDRLRSLELDRPRRELVARAIRLGEPREEIFTAAGSGEGEPESERLSFALPLATGGDRLGCIYIEGRRDALTFDASDLIFFKALASQLALAIDRARLADLQTDHADSERRQLKSELNTLRRALQRAKLVYRSPQMEALVQTASRVAKTDATVLITGGSGTGKELLARTVHELSPRSATPYVILDCSAIPASLIESELFGHEKGAFTGAERRQVGRLAEAHRGTVLLDEIGELPLEVQGRLLRFVQEKQFIPVGGNRPRRVDVRILAATNRNLADEVRAGRFREDLFYRLDVIRLDIPPLRERPDDILLLARHFQEVFMAQYGKRLRSLPPGVEKRLLEHSWPGNVRELQNRILQAVVLCSEERLNAEDLGLAGRGVVKGRTAADADPVPAGEVRESSTFSAPGPGSSARPREVAEPRPHWEVGSSPGATSLDGTLRDLRAALAQFLPSPASADDGLQEMPLGRWLGEDLLLVTDDAAESIVAGAAILGLPESTYRRRLRKARESLTVETPLRPVEWDEVVEVLERLVRCDRPTGGNLMAAAEAALLREVAASYPGNRKLGSALLAVSPPTYRRRLAALTRISR